MARLASVNVGLPREVDWNGRTVFTGAWKAPVDGPRRVRRLNVDGDGQGDLGGHGGENRAVLIYQLASYRFWARELGRTDLAPGMFGENFTVDGLPDDEVCIGDRYRIGETVVEVTQPRVTCYRVGMRLGEPRMASLLVAHRRPGFYCRIVIEGDVEAGQDISLVSRGPEAVSVAEIDALLYLPGHPREALARALRIPALSAGWQDSLRSMLAAAEDPHSTGNTGLIGAGVRPPAWSGFRPLCVTAIHEETPTVRSLLLSDPERGALPHFRAGQSIALRIPHPGASPLIRNYSLSNAPGSHAYRISVKREERGEASGWVHDRVRVGDLLDVAAPRGAFCLDDAGGPTLLLSAGVGVTPVLSMLAEIVGDPHPGPVWWLHGARSRAEHPLADEAERLLNQLPHKISRVFYSQPGPEDRLGIDYDERGHVTAAALRDLDLPADTRAYVCGPVSFMDQMSVALADCGLTGHAIHTERFGARSALTPGIESVARPPHLPLGPPGSGPPITFARSGLTAPWDADQPSLLDFAEACDVPTRWSCRTGVCHNCETALLSGAVRYDPEPLEAPAAGNVLLCVTTPEEPLVLDL